MPEASNENVFSFINTGKSNTYNHASLTITKKASDTGNALKDAFFGLYSGDTLIRNYTTNKDGQFTISTDDPAIADYLPTANKGRTTLKLKETTAPTGYTTVDDTTVTISRDDSTDSSRVTTITYKINGEQSSSTELTDQASQEKISISITKIWSDSNNQDGKRPSKDDFSSWLELYKTVDGVRSKVNNATPVVKEEGNRWTVTYNDLPKYESGNLIAYSIHEVLPKDSYYTVTPEDAIVKNGDILTNSHTNETIDISGAKTWDDSDNQDGKRPESITIRLLANGKEINSKTVTADNSWKYNFTDLPKYAAGKEIDYTITEDAVQDYTTSISGYDVTNSYTPGKTSITVTKVWSDGNNQDGKRPSSIEVQLYADGSEKGDPITLSDSNKWTYTWTDLDEKKDGKNIAYTVQEDKVPDGYTSSVSGDATKGYTITNSYKIQTVDISGTKVWSDQNNQYGVRPDNITIRLWKNGTEVRSTTISGAKDAATWSYSFTGLPKYENGKEITYTVTEDAVAGYTTSISGYTITNSYAPNLVTIQGTKTWDDNNNADGLRPNSIVVNLLADGTAVQRQEVKAAADGTWTYSFVNLPSMANGKKITYTVTEDPVPGYTTTINGYNIINTHRTQKIDIPVTKVWANGASATSVEVELVANGTATGNKLTLSAATNWKGTFTGLDQYAADGSEITYTVQENTKGFNTTIAGSAVTGFVITNSAIEANVTELHLHKYWADSDDVDHFRPTSVTVQIYADGAPYGNAVTLSVDNNWTYDLTGIPAEQDGHAINYTVEELSVPDHYTELVDAVGGNTFNITNIRKENGTWGVNDGTGDTFSVLGASRTRNVKGASRDRNTASTETTESVEGTRRARTGDSLPYGNLAATAAATAVLVGWGISRRKKKNQKDDDSKD